MWLDSICLVMEKIGIEVITATTAPAEALAAVAAYQPQLFVLDPAVQDEDIDWMTFIEEALAASPGLKVVAMSACGDRAVIEAAFAAGASAYVVKTASESDIGAALRLATTTAIHVAAGIPTVAAGAAQAGQSEALTRREYEILALVTEGHSNAAIGRKLWVTEQTVKFHLSNLYRKIGVQNRTAAARWAELHGVVENVPDDVEPLAAGSVA